MKEHSIKIVLSILLIIFATQCMSSQDKKTESQTGMYGSSTAGSAGAYAPNTDHAGGGELKVAMRTEGVFQQKGCVTYEVIDRVEEDEGYYRFSDFQAGDDRAYTEFRFGKGEFIMEVYTNKFNQVSPLEIHSRWKATLGDRSAAAEAIAELDFPQPVMVYALTYSKRWYTQYAYRIPHSF